MLKNLDIIDFKYKNKEKKQIDQDDELTVKWRYICSGILMLLSLPFIYQRSLGNLRYNSALIVLTIAYTIIITIAEFPGFYNHYHNHPDGGEKYVVVWVSKPFKLKWVQGWATMMLSYYGHLLFFFMRGELMNKSERRLNKLINLLTILLTVFFCAFSVIGYLSVGETNVPDLFTLRGPAGTLALL